jgi:hypothetical protein
MTNRLAQLLDYSKAIDDGMAIAIIWTSCDVLQQAEDDDIELTEKEVKWILANMSAKHDANLGITWETITFWIDEAVRQRSAE